MPSHDAVQGRQIVGFGFFFFFSVSFRDLRLDWSFGLHYICNILIKAKCCCFAAGHSHEKEVTL